MHKFLIILSLLFCTTSVFANDYANIMKDYIDAPTASVSYVDIETVPWAAPAIETLSSYGILQGSPNGSFYPESPITRGEFTKIIISAFGLFDPNAEISYSDSKPTDWHNKYIGSAVKHGISQGISGNAYGTEDSIKREEMFVMTYRAISAAKLRLPTSSLPRVFSDEVAISAYAKEAVNYLSSANMLLGDPSGALQPKEASTRAEACVLILKILQTTLEGDIV